MNKRYSIIIGFMLAICHLVSVATTIDPDAKYAWGENIGWLNAGSNNGLFINSGTIEGYLWAENVGWISMSCENTKNCDENVDYGVTYDEDTGHWSGYGWGENIGWVNFSCLTNDLNCNPEEQWGVTMNPQDGSIFGFAWAENVGWLNFNGMKTTPTVPGSIFSDGFESN